MIQFIDDHRDEFAGRAGLQASADRPANLLPGEGTAAVEASPVGRGYDPPDPHGQLRRLQGSESSRRAASER